MPRSIRPGGTYFITRRCTQRQFLLRPDDETNGAFLYCLAEAAHRFGIEVISVCAQSNHYHAVVHDPEGRLPEFLAHFHKMLAKVMNCRWRRWENMWATEPTCITECIDAAAVFEETVYVVTNGVREHLVDKVVNWPGANSLGAQLRNKTLRLERPRWFFDPNGKMPKTVELSFARPKCFAHLTHEEWADKLRRAVEEEEAKAAAARLESGIRIVGRKAILSASPNATAVSKAPRRKLRPRIACKDAARRIDAIRREKSFRDRYASALAKLRAGVRDVIFPAGTYLLRIRGLVHTEPFPAPG